MGQGPGMGLRSLPSLALKLTQKILNVAWEPQVPTYAPNTNSGLIYLVWIIVKDCQDTTLRRASLLWHGRVQFHSDNRIPVARTRRGRAVVQNYGCAKIG
jgi:hypothetical protein